MDKTTSSSVPTFPRYYVDARFEPSSWSDIEPVVLELLHRRLPDPASLLQWLLDWSEYQDVVDEVGVCREIAKDQNMKDEKARQDHLEWVEKTQPRIKSAHFELQKKLVENQHAFDIGPEFIQFAERSRNQVKIFHSDNLALEAQCEKLVSDYYKVRSAQQTECDWENPDRSIRETTYSKMVVCRSKDYEAIDSIIDSLLVLRCEIAENAGFSDFRAFRWRQLDRFDYTPEDCLKLVDAVEETIVPRLHRIDERQAARLSVSKLREWDCWADSPGLAPLEPFSTAEEWTKRTRETIRSIHPSLVTDFDVMVENDLLDLEPRPNKINFVGYQQFLRERRLGFIFLYPKFNQRDVEKLLHECGHAFHTLAYRDQRLTWNRNPPPEFAEVVGNAMEIIGCVHLEGTFYDRKDTIRARIKLLEGILVNLAYTARGEAFLHWLHTTPGHTPEQRNKAWLGLGNRLGRSLDWTGLEDYHGHTWSFVIPHLFFAPFYWVEYLFGQVGALQLWRNFLDDPASTLSQLRHAMGLGYTVPTPDLFSAAGICFSISTQLLEELVELVEDELEKLYRS